MLLLMGNNQSNLPNNLESKTVETTHRGAISRLYLLYFTLIISGSCETFIDLFTSEEQITGLIKTVFLVIYNFCAFFIAFVGINNTLLSPHCLVFLIIINSSSYIYFYSKEDYKLIFLLQSNLLKTTFAVILASIGICLILKYFQNIFYFLTVLFFMFKLYQSDRFSRFISTILGTSIFVRFIAAIIFILLVIFLIKRYCVIVGLLFVYGAVGSISVMVGGLYSLFLMTDGGYGSTPENLLDFVEGANIVYILGFVCISMILQYTLFSLMKKQEGKWGAAKMKEADKEVAKESVLAI